MLQILMYTVTAIALYVLSDKILFGLEKWRGKPFASRNIVFFMIIMLLSVSVFEGIQHFFGDVLPTGPEATTTEQGVPQPEEKPELLRSPALPPLEVEE